MKRRLLLAFAALAAADAHTALPGNSEEGKRLHDENCTGCHDAGVYAPERRQVRTLDGLREQIGGCNHMAGAHFSSEQLQSVLKYLNDSFYHLN